MRARSSDWPLVENLEGVTGILWREAFDATFVVCPADAPVPLAPWFRRVLCGIDGCPETPMTGLQVVETLRLAAQPGVDVSFISEPDVMLFDREIVTRHPVPPSQVLVAALSENQWPTRFDGAAFFNWPMMASPATWEVLLRQVCRVRDSNYWMHSDRFVTRLMEMAYILGRQFHARSCIGDRRVAEGIPFVHPVKDERRARKLLTTRQGV